MTPAPEERAAPATEEDPIAALSQRYDHLRVSLTGYFRRRCLPDAEDAAADVFQRVIVKISRGLNLPCTVEQYCFRVAKYIAFEYFRRRNTEEVPESLPAPERSDLGLFDAEELLLFRECMDTLTKEEAEFIRKYLHEDKQQLALDEGTTPKALAVYFFRLIQRIKKGIRHKKSAGNRNNVSPVRIKGKRKR